MEQWIVPLKAIVLSLNVSTYTCQVMCFMVKRTVLDGKVTGRYHKADECAAMESGLVMWKTSANPLLGLPVWCLSGIKKVDCFSYGIVTLGKMLRLPHHKTFYIFPAKVQV